MKVYIGKDELKGLAFNVYSEDIKDATADKESVLSGKAFYNNDGRQEGTMPNIGAFSAMLEVGESITLPKGYHNGEGVVSAKGMKVATGTITVYNGSFSNNSHISTPELPFKPVGVVFIWLAYENGEMISGGYSSCAIATADYKQTIHAYSRSSMGTSSSDDYSEANKLSSSVVTFGDNYISISDNSYPFPKGEKMFYVAWGE